MTTVAPSRARVSTQASPIPDAPPVTSAIFPSTWPMFQLPFRRADERSVIRHYPRRTPQWRNALRFSALHEGGGVAANAGGDQDQVVETPRFLSRNAAKSS